MHWFGKVSLLFSLLMLMTGCRGLANGDLAAVKTETTSPRAGQVYLVRGWIGVFSTGVDDLGAKMKQAGLSATVYQSSQHWPLADEIIKKYKGVPNPEPLVLVGHSYGADDVVSISRKLADNGLKVDLLITLDCTTPDKLPSNVVTCYNFYQSQPTDFIPLFRGIPLEEEKPGVVKLHNIDLRKERKDLLESNTNHINIDKNHLLHAEVVKQVLSVCPPRATWTQQRGQIVPRAADAIKNPNAQ